MQNDWPGWGFKGAADWRAVPGIAAGLVWEDLTSPNGGFKEGIEGTGGLAGGQWGWGSINMEEEEPEHWEGWGSVSLEGEGAEDWQGLGPLDLVRWGLSEVGDPSCWDPKVWLGGWAIFPSFFSIDDQGPEPILEDSY